MDGLVRGKHTKPIVFRMSAAMVLFQRVWKFVTPAIIRLVPTHDTCLSALPKTTQRTGKQRVADGMN